MEDIRDLILNNVRKMQGNLEHHYVKILDGAWDWKAFLDCLDVNFSGHVTSHAMKVEGTSAAHCFRFLKRKNLDKYSYKEVPHQDGTDTNWPELKEDPDDIISSYHNLRLWHALLESCESWISVSAH